MQRRTFLKAASALCALPGAAGAQRDRTRRGFVVVSDLDVHTPVPVLRALLEGFEAAGLPISLLVPVTGGAAPDPASDLARLLREMALRNPGLLELVPHVPRLASLSAHFRARAAFEARESVRELLGFDEAEPQLLSHVRSLSCNWAELPTSPEGIRSAGFRTVLMLPERHGGPTRSELWPDGTVRLVGGRWASVGDASADLPGGGEKVLYLSARDLAMREPDQLREVVLSYGLRLVSTHPTGSWLRLAEAAWRASGGYTRLLALHIYGADESNNLAALLEELAGHGLNSVAAAISRIPDGTEVTPTFWIGASPDPEWDRRLQHFSFSIEPGSGAVRRTAATPLPPGLGVRLSGAPGALRAGIDSDGHLRLPTCFATDLASLRKVPDFAAKASDFVLAVPAQLLDTQLGRNTVRQTLSEVLGDGVTDCRPLPELVRTLMPRSAELAHLRRTEAAIQRLPQPEGITRIEAEALREDAAVAWLYFEKWTNPETGLCPATVSFAPGNLRLHEAVTMWDVGSHLNALHAALRLGLIDEETFRRALRQIMPNLAGRRSDGRLLPQGWIRTDRLRWGTRDFNAYDTGRLLAALHALDAEPAAEGLLGETVKSWDLDQTILAGRIHSIRSGSFRSSFRSHYAHYTTRAFRAWGYDALSPAEVLLSQSETDGRVRLLERASWMGPMGAEPGLLEALELGISSESEWLAETLFAAQLEHYDRTGELVCVSEGPIDREPWFTYQGLKFDAEDVVWTTDTVASLPEHRTPEFAARNLVISTKAAYLWSAWRSHRYTHALVDFMRRRTRTENGLASGIYMKDGRVMKTYTDINTNGIVLQAVAALLQRE